jgi:hypothetical protein
MLFASTVLQLRGRPIDLTHYARDELLSIKGTVPSSGPAYQALLQSKLAQAAPEAGVPTETLTNFMSKQLTVGDLPWRHRAPLCASYRSDSATAPPTEQRHRGHGSRPDSRHCRDTAPAKAEQVRARGGHADRSR